MGYYWYTVIQIHIHRPALQSPFKSSSLSSDSIQPVHCQPFGYHQPILHTNFLWKILKACLRLRWGHHIADNLVHLLAILLHLHCISGILMSISKQQKKQQIEQLAKKESRMRLYAAASRLLHLWPDHILVTSLNKTELLDWSRLVQGGPDWWLVYLDHNFALAEAYRISGIMYSSSAGTCPNDMYVV